MKQNEAVRVTLERLGGIATLNKLNQEVFKIKDCEWKTKTPFASIRRIVQLDKEIYKIKPGLYALKKFKKELEEKGIIVETEKNKKSKEVKDFNHSYYQGLILEYGNLRGFKTFVPNQDKRKIFLDKNLESVSTLYEIPYFTYPNIVKRASSIDVVWFNERMLPHSFFEVEHSTDIQNSLLKYNDLQDFNSRMIIIADIKRKSEYENKIKYSAFTSISKRVIFLDYESLYRQYEIILEQTNKGFLL
ncbi:MAG TPA: hypothetical protein VIK14_13280 [Ignavibacteria bacterium]